MMQPQENRTVKLDHENAQLRDAATGSYYDQINGSRPDAMTGSTMTGNDRIKMDDSTMTGP